MLRQLPGISSMVDKTAQIEIVILYHQSERDTYIRCRVSLIEKNRESSLFHLLPPPLAH